MLADIFKLVRQGFTHAGKHFPDLMPARTLYFLAEFNNHLEMASVFFYFVIE